MVTTNEIRVWAMTLPEVTEKPHPRFKVPVWQVRGKNFLGMGPRRDDRRLLYQRSVGQPGRAR